MRVGDLANLLGLRLVGDENVEISRCSDLKEATPGSLGFLASTHYIDELRASSISALIALPTLTYCANIPVILANNPYLAFARAASILHAVEKFTPEIDPRAQIHPDCEIGEDVYIGPYTVISKPCKIGSGSYIGPHCVFVDQSKLGEQTRFIARVTVCGPLFAGSRLLVHPGVVIGSDGFGLANDQGRWVKMPQLGRVVIGNDVEIGANTTIDRGALRDTIIEDGVKIDNQVQIAHNVIVGAHTAIAGCVGIAGSAIIGKHCAIGGGAGIQGHIEIADGVQVTGMTKISQSITQPGIYTSGTAAQENRKWLRNALLFKQLDEIFKRIKKLGK